jgi:hypothetical protein
MQHTRHTACYWLWRGSHPECGSQLVHFHTGHIRAESVLTTHRVQVQITCREGRWWGVVLTIHHLDQRGMMTEAGPPSEPICYAPTSAPVSVRGTEPKLPLALCR